MEETVGQDVPAAFWEFLRAACHLRPAAWRTLVGDTLPEPAKQLLFHDRDMTSTLATFHGSALRVEVLQRRELGGMYLREVFLRTENGDRIVEYGVIAIAMEQFSVEQQEAIRAGRIPLGGVLHRFTVEFESTPIRFFAVAAEDIAATPIASLAQATCYGRLNRLAKPTGEPLAWILEILPPFG